VIARLLPLLLFFLPAGSCLSQGTTPPGISSRSLISWGGSAFLGGFDVLPGGDVLYFLGSAIMRWDGSKSSRVAAFPKGTFGAFLRVTTRGILVGESTVGGIYFLDLSSGKLSQAAKVKFPFDLAESPSGGIYLSANPGWGGASSGNRIYLLDPVKHTLDEIARVSGPSGPLAFDRAGNLYYAVQSSTYPTPPGAVRILRWEAARVKAAAGPGRLSEKEAVLVRSGLDGAFALSLDRLGRIYLTDPQKGRLLRLTPGRGRPEVLFQARPFSWTGYTYMRLVEGAGPATIDPWQPAGGGRILLAASDYLSFSSLLELRAARPRLTSSPWPRVPSGPLTLALQGGPPSSPVLFLVSPAGNPGEIHLLQGGTGPLFFGVLPHPWLLVLPSATGSGGGAALHLAYPGGGPMTVYCQVFFSSAGGGWATSSLLPLKLL